MSQLTSVNQRDCKLTSKNELTPEYEPAGGDKLASIYKATKEHEPAKEYEPASGDTP